MVKGAVNRNRLSEIEWTVFYTYNSQGLLTEIEEDPNFYGRPQVTEKFRYDSNGNLMERIYENKLYLYEYDDFGNRLLQKIVNKSNDTIIQEIRYTYDCWI